uniref:Uncharacterized protein C11orf65 homolog n=1 Tax=Saccoglossus kowalevskii TaxID=10224 RepID=A0ABM0M5K0_SACKO|nr:PREDICTED: uncharacterized protein C11orf65 homolog [Saccoglossus kowalevskii]
MVPSPMAENENTMSRLEWCYHRYYTVRVQSGENDIASFEDFCANYIQNWWFRVKKGKRVTPSRSSFKSSKTVPRSMKAVRILQRQSSHHSASSKASSKASTVKSVKKVRTEPLGRMEAAVIIQRGWRRHIDVQVYKYYRDLINFRNRGDPAMMLRCVNPKETPLLDAASGVHVKFRLAGERFPPNIYYKIFTHRPIQDLCANSPKDYTRPEAKLKMMKDVHNKHDKRITNVKVGWYQRMDNNGWRLVSDRLLQRIDSDPITWESSHRKINFHHDKLKRRQDVEKKRKRRKVDWMKKMYREGMLKAKSDDKETISLIEGAAQGMVETIEAEGPDVIEEWEVDELLDWTNALNFDDYLTAWKEVATSANSEATAEEALTLATNKRDPFQITITAGRTPPIAPSPSRATTIPSAAHVSRPSPVSQLSTR